MFNDKVVVITGGASGIGLASAKRLLIEGAKVALLDVNDNVLEISKKLGGNVLGIKCDVSNENDVKTSIEMVASVFVLSVLSFHLAKLNISIVKLREHLIRHS